MTTWKRPQYIGGAIQSVLDQTFTDWEIVIVDDGSPDNTAEVAREWEKKDKRIQYLQLKHVGRIAIVSNAGLRKAKGEFVAILDDDDWWLDKQKLEKQIGFLEKNPDYLGCGGAYVIVNGEGKETGRFMKPQSDEAIRRVALYANPMANSTTMFRRMEAGFYDESLPQFADWDFWLRLGKNGKLYNFPEYFSAYRMWHGGASFNTNQKELVGSAIVIVRRYRNDYPRFWLAFLGTAAYWCYARLPLFMRRRMNAFFSKTKKFLFSGSGS